MNMIRKVSSEELDAWNRLILENPDSGHIYQTLEWGDYKGRYGWHPERLVWESDKKRAYFQALVKNAPGFGAIWYIPKGPGIFAHYKSEKAQAAAFKTLSTELALYIQKHDPRAFMLMVEPEVYDDELKPKQVGYQKSIHDLQFRATIIVDIDKNDDDLLASFKQKTRYNIRLATKKGVTIEKRDATDEMVDEMYKLMGDTQGRAGFYLRPKHAFRAYWQSFAKSSMGQFFVAVHEGEILAAEYAMIFGEKAYYKEGGSSGAKRNLMAPYLLQYEVMRWARDRGAKEYDLIAVPPKDQLNPEHSMYGLYQFKSGFNQEITQFVGCWELPLRASAYARWQKAEPLFHRVYSRVKHNIFW
ncbi:peptidoglycan bridge formation glycyltransferase FemA/FemB family protein [bacterium]|nr:MAG: peptidoglycan bridge formation glycyltransferase FemA/FemB family protein [bacterium]